MIINSEAVVFSFATSSDEEASFEQFVDFHSVFDAEFMSYADLKKTVVFSDKAAFKDFAIEELDYVEDEDQETVSEFIESVLDLDNVSSYTVLIFNVASEQDYFVVVIDN